jgi:hypothetical protein
MGLGLRAKWIGPRAKWLSVPVGVPPRRLLAWVVGVWTLLAAAVVAAQPPTGSPLDLPTSHLGWHGWPATSLHVSITREGVFVDGELVLEVQDGHVVGGTRRRSMRWAIEEIENAVDPWFRGHTEAVIAAERSTPYELLTDVRISAGAGGIRGIALMVGQTTWPEVWTRDSSEGLPQVGLRLAELSPRSAPGYETPIPPEGPPRLMLFVVEDGIVIEDGARRPEFYENGLNLPVPGCDPGATCSRGSPMAICSRRDVPATEPLLERMDFRALYNRLVEIRRHPAWQGQWGPPELIVGLTFGPEAPLELVVRTMSVVQTVLDSDHYETWAEFITATPVPGEALFEGVVLLTPSTP